MGIKKACLVVDPFYQKNQIFNILDARMNRDDCAYPFHRLKMTFQERGVDLSTCDINKPDDSDFILYMDMPKRVPQEDEIKRSFLMAMESPLVKPNNHKSYKHAGFTKIFTWDDRLVDGRKYVKVNYSFRFPTSFKRTMGFQESRMFCMIAANKKARFPGELYSRRLEIIRWFQERHPDQFDLYGVGWDRYYFGGSRALRKLNRLTWLARALAPSLSVYRGKVPSKSEVLGRYRFSFALENIMGMPGYITEKIFDCLFSGCIPIYLGAPNIEEYIPKETFIDMRDFSNLNELQRTVSAMPEKEFLWRQEAIKDYLCSEKASLFSADRFALTIAEAVLNS